jgi:AcrR family transcriptional regulator
MRYVYSMARPVDTQRRSVLLEQIVEHLLDQPLATLSFRTLATALGVSTYTLVYQFGSRAELVHEIVREISSHRNALVEAVSAESGDIDTHLRNMAESWQWILQPRNRQLQRLEFEASMLEAQDPGFEPITPRVFERWHSAGRQALLRMGLEEDDADLEARIITNTIYGCHYDLIVNRDEARATEAFERAVASYADRIRQLMPHPDSLTRSA